MNANSRCWKVPTISLRMAPSGPGSPPWSRRAWARRLVSRRTSPSIQSRASWSRCTGSSSPRSRHTSTAKWMSPCAARLLAHRAHGHPLVHERGERDPPALADRAEPLRVRDAQVGEVDLVELGVAGELPQRTHLDARRLHVDEEVGQALVLRRLGIGAGEQQAPLGDVGLRGPDLLTVDTHSSPSRTARVLSAARSEPAPGSLNIWHQISSQAKAGRRWRSSCSSVRVGDERGPGHADAHHVDVEVARAPRRRAGGRRRSPAARVEAEPAAPRAGSGSTPARGRTARPRTPRARSSPAGARAAAARPARRPAPSSTRSSGSIVVVTASPRCEM